MRRAALTQGAVGPLLARLTLPMIIGILSIITFNLADTFFVARLGTDQLAAMSFTFPVVLVIGSLALGLGVGASAVISRAIGEGDSSRVQRLTTDALSLALLIVISVGVIGLLTIDPLFHALGAEDEILGYIRTYMSIWYWGVGFVVVPMVGNSAIRATGDTRTPSLVMMVVAVVNIILDPMFIFGIGPFPELGIAGAAIATVIARAIVFIVSVWVLIARENMISFARVPWSDIFASWRAILYLGLPAAATQVIVPASLGVITRLVAAFGPEAVAAMGVASRVEALALTVIMALGSVLGPFVGQNWGAGEVGRVRLGIRLGQQFSVLFGVGMFAVLVLFAHPIAEVFSSEPGVVEVIILYLTVVGSSYGMQGVLQLSTTALNVLNKPFEAAGLSLLRMVGLYIPLALVGRYFFGLQGIFAAAALASGIAGILAFIRLQQVTATASPHTTSSAAVPASSPAP
ncbi:MAG: MATE family efflux transporter [Deinococcota bacterium]